MQGDDPPYLSVGTAVSAKYKGAFCEAKVSKVVRIVKCKVTYKMGLGTATVNDEQIKGTLRVGQIVQAKHPERKEFIDATITKIQDCSQYTVVFDDGDITTLRRTALCLKSGRHFNESETLDQLPLTHPEHFGNPVMGGRRGRRSRQLKEDSSEGEGEEENEPDLELYSADTGKVVSVEASDKKRNKDNWFPGLIVMPSAQPTVRINVKDEFLVRSFKDGRYYTVPKKEVSEFKREMASRVESSTLLEAVEKAIKFLDNDELPVHWERNSLFNVQSQYTDSDENYTDTSDDEPTEEKDHFVAQLYKFMDDSGTPLNKTPTIGSKDVDLYRLFRLVHKLGGFNRVTNQNKWKSITTRLKFPQNQNTYNHVKQVYKKWLLSYEAFFRTLGVTMLNHTRNSKKNRGRTLIRDRDRVTPVQSPRPEKEDEMEIKKEEDEKLKPRKIEKKPEEEKKRRDTVTESSDNSSDVVESSDNPSTSKDTPRLKRTDSKSKEKKVKPATGDKVKALVEKFEEQSKKNEKDKEEEKEKVQQTRSKSQVPRNKEVVSPERRTRDTKTPMRETQVKPVAKIVTKKPTDEEKDKEKEKKRGRKRINPDDKTSNSDSSVSETILPAQNTVSVGDKLKVYYGPTHESKVTYEAKVIEIDNETNAQTLYLVHYTGWNTRYDEWITFNRIAENLSATTKAKRMKHGMSPGAKASKPAAKRGRGMSITGRSTIPDAPRSTTPSSVTSSSSRTKSPATPASRSGSRVTRQGEMNRRTRRTSAQTDISVHTDSESDDGSESDAELSRTRSGTRSEESEPKTYRKRLIKTKGDKRKDDEDTEKEEDSDRPKRARKLIKATDIKPIEDSDDEASNQAKGREFDLNQIRSELKGINKAIKLTSAETSEKEIVSSDESTTIPDVKDLSEPEQIEEKKIKIEAKSPSSEDIYEFKEPEPFEFESRKITDDKLKKRVPRLFEEVEKSPKKKSPKSPCKTDVKECLEDKKRVKRPLIKKEDEIKKEDVKEEEIEDKTDKEERKSDDRFDKLVESPSFHIGKCATPDKLTHEKITPKVLNMEEPMSIFELAETSEENSEDRLELSDSEERANELVFTRASPLFSNFGKNSPDHIIEAACDSYSSKLDDIKQKDSEEDDEDPIRASIQRAIAQSSLTDDDSNDLMLKSQHNFGVKPAIPETKITTSSITLNRLEPEDSTQEEEVVEESKKVFTFSKQTLSVFQETDSSFLENLCASPQFTTKPEDLKDITVKTGGTKIADTILQKFNLIKKEEKPPEEIAKVEETTAEVKIEKEPEEEKVEAKASPVDGSKSKIFDVKSKVCESKVEAKPKVESKIKPVETKTSETAEFKKRSSKKFVSREFIEDSESDSDSDSGQRLIIARSDEDSQTSTSFDRKVDIKESDSNISNLPQTEDSQSQEPERNFKFDDVTEKSEDVAEVKVEEQETVKEEEPDSHLHSMLLCEETIPGSPAPPPANEPKPKTKAALEMPFASAPSSSSCSSNKNAILQQEKNKEKQPSPVPLVIPLDNRENRKASTVLDNTPPTTPESTISNLSPRGEIGGLSPNTADNESCKSIEVDTEYSSNQRLASSNKISTFSEEDSLMNIEPQSCTKKVRDDLPSPCKKRRRSCKGDSNDVPSKRGRKPNRSRHNSDSDDTSEHSAHGIGSNLEARLNRSPRPSKYNFFVELDPSLDSAARIAVLQQKLQDLRKTYADVKAELVTIERRRKKIRRREREALKAAKQEMACT